MDLTAIDHVEKCLSRITQDLDKEDFRKWVQLYAEELQILEDTFLVLSQQKSISIASGVWLDYIGNIVGVSRLVGQSDESYRISLNLQIGINNSDGTPDVMMALVRQYTNSENVTLTEGSYAHATLRVDGQSNIDGTLWELIQKIKPVGTSWIIQSDFNGDAFIPSWELQPSGTEDFEVSADGVTNTSFEVSIDGVTNTPFSVSISGNSYYPPSLGRDVLPWVGRTAILGMDVGGGGVAQLIFTTEEEDGAFLAFGDRSEIAFEKPLTWEVYEGSSPIII
jgi:hypothetical protein